jgi:hypothetical protein
MKILYLTCGDHVDYQNDCLLIGLKELFGPDIVDYNKQSHNYITYPEEKARSLYGMGMSVTRVLPDIEVDRTDITGKIKRRFFDYVVYGSIWRCNSYIKEILEYYPKEKVIAVDGEDETNIHESFNLGITYFKRELIYQHPRLKPISFAIPTSKLNLSTAKIKDFSFITPLDKSTYVYSSEESYYNDYREARFGVTLKKAGWDCMRHYEILANGCIPYFHNIESCPALTMTLFPKELCLQVRDSLIKSNPTDVYDRYYHRFHNHLINNNTTLAVANYFINNI